MKDAKQEIEIPKSFDNDYSITLRLQKSFELSKIDDAVGGEDTKAKIDAKIQILNILKRERFKVMFVLYVLQCYIYSVF